MYRQSVILLCLLSWYLPLFAQPIAPDDWLVEAGLAHELDLSQVIDDVTVTLDWAYADTQGFALQITLENLPHDMQVSQFRPVDGGSRLRDLAGNEFLSRGGAFGPADDNSEPVSMVLMYSTQAIRHNSETDEWLVENDYFQNQYDVLPTELALQFELNIADMRMPPIAPGENPVASEPSFEGVGPFIFDFAVPLPVPVELEPNQTVEAKDLRMTLESLAITPVFAEARLCIELPDGGDWQPQATISVNGTAGTLSGGGFINLDQIANQERRCFDLRFVVPHAGAPQSVVVSLDAIEKSLAEGPTDWRRIQNALVGEGIEMIVNAEGRGISYEMPNLPEGMTERDAINLAREMLGDRILGPWKFEIELP